MAVRQPHWIKIVGDHLFRIGVFVFMIFPSAQNLERRETGRDGVIARHDHTG
jgi:hypothetical protein